MSGNMTTGNGTSGMWNVTGDDGDDTSSAAAHTYTRHTANVTDAADVTPSSEGRLSWTTHILTAITPTESPSLVNTDDNLEISTEGEPSPTTVNLTVMPPTKPNITSFFTPSSTTTSRVWEPTPTPTPLATSLAPTTDVDRTRSGIPVSVIWVPYLVFTLVLLVLMAVSFLRFHRKNGHKYRERREVFWRQLNMDSIITQFQAQPGVEVTSPPNGGLNVATSSSSSHQHRSHKPKTTRSGGKKSRRPLVFTSNLNGSMVDLRCGESESLHTFHAQIDAPPPTPKRSPRAVVPRQHKSAASSSPFFSGRSHGNGGGAKARGAEPEDDQVFLLHKQTRL